jgi:MHS family proline/betaine transporter-like MFS transporter
MDAARQIMPSRAGITRPRLIVAATLGNALEFYDFTIYSFFALTIGKLFFTSLDPYQQLLASVATFGVGFVMRPLGGVLIGTYADRHGRRSAMLLTLLLMAAGSAMIGLCPTYAQWGILAPTTIVVARLIQGFSTGGEVGPATALLVESSSSHNRGYLGSWQFASQGLGVALGAIVAEALARGLSPADLASWGWRIPFLLGILIAPLGMMIRARLGDHDNEASSPVGTPLSWLFRHEGKSVVLGVLLTIGTTVSAYIVAFYLPTYAVHELHVDSATALLAALLSGIAMLVVSPLAGLASDRFGRKRVIWVGRIGLIVATYPAFIWIAASPGVVRLLTSVSVLSVLLAIHAAPAITMLSELFSKRVRATGMAVVYSIGVAIFGGFAQFVATWLIQISGDKLAPAYYMIGCIAVSSLALPFIEDKAGLDLDAERR